MLITYTTGMLLKDLKIEKCTCEYFCFDYQILDSEIIFSVKNKWKGKCVKSSFSLIQFLNKATYNSFIYFSGQKSTN